MRIRSLALVAAVGLLTLLPAARPSLAEPPDPERDWSFEVTPYLWLPAMTGDARLGGVSVDVETDIADLFDNDLVLSFSAQLEAWYRKRFGLLVNGLWSILRQNDNLEGTLLEFDLAVNTGYFELFGAYDFGARAFTSEPGSATWSVQPLVGARVSVMRLELDFENGGSPESTKVWADPLLGLRAVLRFGPDNRWRWQLRYDLGGFGAGSDFTWQAFGLLEYDLALWGGRTSLGLGARALYQDFDDGSFGWDVTQYGPMLSFGIRF